MSEENQWAQVNDVIEMDDMMICAEVVFENGEIPYEQHRFGNIEKLTEALSDGFLKQEAERVKADSAKVQNIYFRGRMKSGAYRIECRIGSQGVIDLEGLILKEEE